MKLSTKQIKFSVMVANLIMHADKIGYGITFGDAYRSNSVTYGHPGSLHRKRLAVDLNLFRDGVYLRSALDHKPLGVHWETIGGSWGGRFGESSPGAGDGQDGNHYSLEHEGMK